MFEVIVFGFDCRVDPEEFYMQLLDFFVHPFDLLVPLYSCLNPWLFPVYACEIGVARLQELKFLHEIVLGSTGEV
jgi:hypothetical protein